MSKTNNKNKSIRNFYSNAYYIEEKITKNFDYKDIESNGISDTYNMCRYKFTIKDWEVHIWAVGNWDGNIKYISNDRNYNEELYKMNHPYSIFLIYKPDYYKCSPKYSVVSYYLDNLNTKEDIDSVINDLIYKIKHTRKTYTKYLEERYNIKYNFIEYYFKKICEKYLTKKD